MSGFYPKPNDNLSDLENFVRDQFFPFTRRANTEHLSASALAEIEMRGTDICVLTRMIQEVIMDGESDELDIERVWSLTRSIIAIAAQMQVPINALGDHVRSVEIELAKAAHREPAAA